MSPTSVGMLTAILALLITLFGIVWKGATIAGEMHAGLAELRATVAELKDGLKQLAEVPVLRRRVETLETVATATVSKVEDLWRKAFSTDKHLAVLQAQRSGSSPDLKGTDP